jgi:hypothetical protein
MDKADPIFVANSSLGGWRHEPGCPVLTAGGNPTCTCTPEQKEIKRLKSELSSIAGRLEAAEKRVRALIEEGADIEAKRLIAMEYLETIAARDNGIAGTTARNGLNLIANNHPVLAALSPKEKKT